MEFVHEIMFQVNFRHGFYEDGVCRSLHFSPTQECIRNLRNYRLQFKNTVDGFIIIAEKKEEDGIFTPIIPIDVNAKFNFKIFSLRKDFLNITDSDLEQIKNQRKFFFRNSNSDPFVITGNRTTFTTHNNTPIDQALVVSNSMFIAPIKEIEDPVKIVLRNFDYDLIFEKTVPRNNNNEIVSSSILFSQVPIEENIYVLQQVDSSGAVTSEDFYFLTEEAIEPDIAGILQLNFNTIISSSASSEFGFNINISNRKIKWVYRLQVEGYDLTEITNNYDPAELRLNDLITDPSPNIIDILGTTFEKEIISTSLPPGVLAIITFKSLESIEIKESSYKGIKLIDDGTPRDILINLPTPDTLYLTKTDNPGEYKSESAIKIK